MESAIAANALDFNRLDHFVRMAAKRPSGWSISVIRATAFIAHAARGFHHQFGQTDGVFFFCMNAPEPVFTSQNQRVDSFGHFFAHDGGQIRPIFSTVEVTFGAARRSFCSA